MCLHTIYCSIYKKIVNKNEGKCYGRVEKVKARSTKKKKTTTRTNKISCTYGYIMITVHACIRCAVEIMHKVELDWFTNVDGVVESETQEQFRMIPTLQHNTMSYTCMASGCRITSD